MARPVRIESYYAASAHAAPDRAELESSVDCDVCVVGGGIAGCSTLHLAELGYKVVLLDEYRVGWGASGRSGAQAIHGVASGQTKLERLIGAAAARTVWDVSLEGLALMRELIGNNAAVCDMNWVLDYYRRSADHRLLFGGRVSHAGFGSFDATAATRERMLRVFPQLAAVRIEYSWGGYVDATLNRAPNFGRLASNIYFLQGFSGHGIALTGIAGKLVAQAIAGTAERFDVFAKIPHRSFPSTTLRRPTLALAMLYYRLRDSL